VSRGVLAIAWMASACWSASAAELTTTLSKENKTIVILNGELADGDASRFRDILRASSAAGKPVSGLRLNSPGGSMREGVRLAAVLQGVKVVTVVATGATCAAACFIPFIAGSQKYVSTTATIGVPGAASKSDLAGETPAIVRVVKELKLLDAVVTKMLATSEGQITWLTADDLRAMGVTLTGKPVLSR
jgi:hypothetical protein